MASNISESSNENEETNPNGQLYYLQPVVYHNLNHMRVFSFGYCGLALLSLAFTFVLLVHYQGKDMGEQATKMKC